ncbi:Ycf66 family protein [Prochlorococcus marinus]|uniref:Ycf66 family protein n=1 Tax=Prochlorococcus marinus TaxID=1219 RepID=UPI001FD6830D|nr:Ycf66 family protein [Prochlorococcus marinus]
MITYLGIFYIFIGTVFLFVPLFYLELGRPKDLIKSCLNLLIGLILIIKNKTLDDLFFLIFLLFTILVILYLLELFSFRWNQLTAKEKNKLTTFLEFKNNLSKILEAINLGVKNFAKPLNLFNFGSNNQNKSQKKWVRNDKNDNIKV